MMASILRELQTLPPIVVDMIRLWLWLFGLSIIFIPAERLWSLRKQEIARKAVLIDLVYYFPNSLLPKVTLAFPLALMAVAVHAVLPWHVREFVTEIPL